jgi:hypothetical protein
MGSIHAAGEWLRLSEHYRGMTDGELVAIARDRSQLTEIAQQILAQELSQRKLEVKPEKPRSEPNGKAQAPQSTQSGAKAAEESGTRSVDRGTVAVADAEDPYAEERKLVEFLTVWSLRDALEVQSRLDAAGIPFFVGEEKATSVDPGTLNFAQGVSVKIMRIGWPWAVRALEYYEPKDVPASEKEDWEKEMNVGCPSCRSTDVVFEELVKTADGAPRKFRWTCSICGNEWQDDGVATEG